jgi:hypothetical protein
MERAKLTWAGRAVSVKQGPAIVPTAHLLLPDFEVELG